MFFNTISEAVGIVPQYMIADILVNNRDIVTNKDPRAVLGKENSIMGFGKMTGELQRTLTQVSAYILSQQIPEFKNMVVYESLLVEIPTVFSKIEMPTRYLCRIGELVVVPLKGSLTMESDEFHNVKVIMTPGTMYRINNRIDSEFTASSDFLAACYNLLDFDLKRYLMPHDISSPFIRRRDEYLDPEAAQPDPEVPADAY